MPNVRLSVCHKAFKYRGPQLWNLVEDEITDKEGLQLQLQCDTPCAVALRGWETSHAGAVLVQLEVCYNFFMKGFGVIDVDECRG